jgi:hypothetical protein
MHVEP